MSNTAAPGALPRKFRCVEVDGGRVCGRLFTRSFNLRRHVRSQHHNPSRRHGESDDAQTGVQQPYTGRGVYREHMPRYSIKRSRGGCQERAVRWLTAEAKEAFDRRIRELMASWGVGRGHSGTCVLVPAAWSLADPKSIAERYAVSALSSIDRVSLLYKDGDHKTKMSRAAAWFRQDQWPRCGVELDNFLECGPFQRMDGSHLCHDSLCVNPNHIVYETSEVNQSRICCHDEALRLRRNGDLIPAECALHVPPCMLQHASLSALERILIQVHVLRRSCGITQPNPPARPRWHNFPTFEVGLPVSRCPAVSLEPSSLTEVPHDDRPNLSCVFCEDVRSFAGVVAYWSHIFHVHGAEDREDELVGEISRTAAVWKNYSDGRGLAKSTGLKIREALGEGFNWGHVLNWNL